MDANEALKAIKQLAKAAFEQDDPELMRKHFKMVLTVIEKFEADKVVHLHSRKRRTRLSRSEGRPPDDPLR